MTCTGSTLPRYNKCKLLSTIALISSLISITSSTSSTSQHQADDASLELKYRLEEEPDIGTYVGDVRQDTSLTRFYDASVLHQLQFRFIRQQQQQTFSIDAATGVIHTAGRVDRDVLCPGADTCLVKLDVAVQPAQYFRIIRVTIAILDTNDNAPRFAEPKLHFEILESATVGTGLVVPAAIDPDSPEFAVRGYRELTESDTFGLREVRKPLPSTAVGAPSSGGVVTELRLMLLRPLDREQVERYRLKIMAADGGVPPRTGMVDVLIDVVDVNDNSPVFEKAAYDVTVQENMPLRSVLIRLTATDTDSGLNGQVVYELSSLTASSYGSLFAVSNLTGDVIVVGLIDYEQQPVYQLVIVARDLGPDSVPASVTLTVKVTDTNDNSPEIIVDSLTGTNSVAMTSEDAAVDTFVAHVSVSDRDTGNAGRVECFVNDGHFRLKPIANSMGSLAAASSGSSSLEYQLVTAAKLDRETRATYDVGVVCRDMGPESRVSVERVQVRVKDINDNSPKFRLTIYRAELFENNYVGATVLYANATDDDEGENAQLTYSLQGADAVGFRIEPDTGVIKAAISFDREVASEYKFIVVAHDSGKPVSLSGTVDVAVEILDVNDRRPLCTHDRYSFKVTENLPSGAEVGKVTAVDNDLGSHGHVIYALTSEQFSIDRQTGRIQTARLLDREMQSVYHLTVIASDLGVPPLATSCDVTVQIDDVNDNAPVFDRMGPELNTTYMVSTRAKPGHMITRLHARDADAEQNGRVTYEMTSLTERMAHNDYSAISTSGLFEVDQVHGHVRVAASLAGSDLSTFDVVVVARDGGNPPLSTSISISIIVNSSVIDPPPASAEGRRSSSTVRQNLIVVVTLALISGLITVCLVVAIVFIRRGAGGAGSGSDRHRKLKSTRAGSCGSAAGTTADRKYNCRMESSQCVTPPPTHDTLQSVDEMIAGLKSPQVTFSTQPEAIPCSTIDSRKVDGQKSRCQTLPRHEPCNSIHQLPPYQKVSTGLQPNVSHSVEAIHIGPGNGSGGNCKNWQVNQLIHRLRNVDLLDRVSLQSNEEGSNTDSGRGPSEVDGLIPISISGDVIHRHSPAPAGNTVAVPMSTVNVVPIKPCLVTDVSRVTNHIGHPLSTVPEDYPCTNLAMDRHDNRFPGNGFATFHSSNGGISAARNNRLTGPPTTHGGKVRRTGTGTGSAPAKNRQQQQQQQRHLTSESEPGKQRMSTATTQLQCSPPNCDALLSRSPRRVDPLPGKLRVVSDDYDDDHDNNDDDDAATATSTTSGSYALVHDSDVGTSFATGPYSHGQGVRLTTV